MRWKLQLQLSYFVNEVTDLRNVLDLPITLLEKNLAIVVIQSLLLKSILENDVNLSPLHIAVIV